MEGNRDFKEDTVEDLQLKCEVSPNIWMGNLESQAGTLKKVQTLVNRYLRTILQIRWKDRVRNEDLWGRVGQVPMKEEIGTRVWKEERKPKVI